MRQLASIKKIDNIKPIDGADMIELAVIGGWDVVVAKSEGHMIGDHVVYCEIDSFLPIESRFEFLRASSYKTMGDLVGFRLKTIKLRGQVSQGLILSMRMFADFDWDVQEGLDVTSQLGILKYEPQIPAQLSGLVKGNFPGFVKKTDEERIQNLTKDYERLRLQIPRISFFVTEKLDGSSATFYINNDKFGVCSRNLELIETDTNTFWKVARDMKIEEKLRELGRNISIQGELIGEGIQGNPYKIKGHTVRFFNVFDIDTFQKLSLADFNNIIVDQFGFQTVPILELSFQLPETIAELLQAAEGKSILHNQTEREGFVIRSIDNTISFKVISNKFLLKNK